ncbi:MAG TPA: hypothetical protein VIK61_09195 [Acidimicrobiia bacterium]
MTRSRLLVTLAASAAGLLLASLAPSALASAAPARSARASASGAVIGGRVKVDAKAIQAYWTPARMASAKNVDIVIAKTPVTSRLHEVHAGKPGAVAGSTPAAAGLAGRIAGVTPDAFTYPFPYSSWNVPGGYYKKYPWAVNGKIFFTNDGGNYVCSGTVVPSVNGTGNENEVWTAGHCLVNTEVNDQALDTFFEFVPAYNGTKIGRAVNPLGVFTWNGTWETTTAWYYNRDLSEDEAALLMNPNAKGQILGNRTGWAGFAWNQSTDQQFVAFGYPAASPYDGTLQVTDLGASAVLDTGIGGARPYPIGIGNPMTGGSSGGAWFMGWSELGTGYVNGHNDYKYNSQPLAMYSPYQDSTSNLVRCFGAASC